MQKIDYGDINKFLVSIGLVLISLSVITPYLYLKENFGLYIDSQTLENYSVTVQNIILSKQNIITKIQKIIPWASLSLFVIGFVSSIIGLYRWFERQSKLDYKFERELQKLDLEIVALTTEEKEEKAKKEVREIELIEEVEPYIQAKTKSTVEKKTSYIDYMKVEQEVIRRFLDFKSPNFTIYSQQKLGNKFAIDVLMKANSKEHSDRIVEIKYIRNSLGLSIIYSALQQLMKYVSFYERTTIKQVLPVLLIVYDKDSINADMVLEFRIKMMNFIISTNNLDNLKIEFVPSDEINKFDVNLILK